NQHCGIILCHSRHGCVTWWNRAVLLHRLKITERDRPGGVMLRSLFDSNAYRLGSIAVLFLLPAVAADTPRGVVAIRSLKPVSATSRETPLHSLYAASAASEKAL